MSTSSIVERAFGAALYADSESALDTGASLLAADPASDAELARRGEEFVAAAWRRGWQPADLVRIVRRDLDDVHVRLVTSSILKEREGDRSARGARWAAQLDELEAEPHDVRTDRFSRATAVLELYRLLLRLPAIEPLDAPRAATTAAAPQETRMLTRIRALLAKAEATGFPEEAEALSAKAQELMARHSIDEALLAARTHAKDAPGACRIGVEPPYETAKAVLLDAVAGANRCRAVWNEALGFSTVVGFEPDLEAVELLYTSLLVQATAAMTKAEAAQRAGGRKRTKTFRQSFLAAYAHRIGDRLASVAEGQVTATEGELLPVLAARDVAVADHLDRMFPETVTTRIRGVTDEAGWHAGAAAADRARVRDRRPLP
ncbi:MULTISPECIES: DUF2786 domain-containing protein [unclassified Streptomyces]|uniref:DUF2786 domain-containing protein n=1 Tax=unclassified Streptomyces TaxID=2593676 RepID=UPI002258E8CA|nr:MULTISPECIES: DUF2786 domain-containing protein [unclassified Streptomyces]MCX4989426.1 DUF2786 domain-containing protein [Streptomyces sp. NBC_00568]MCX5005352.1 DUF2786 domain-containing protein [Streptomyces sp. NBC_00638]